MLEIIKIAMTFLIALISGAVTYQAANQKAFRWPKLLGFLAALFPPLMLSAISAPNKELRQLNPPTLWKVAFRIVFVFLAIKVILYIGDLFLKSPWLGAIYASTFHIFGRDVSFVVIENLVEFSDAKFLITGSWAPHAAFIALGVFLAAFLWQLKLLNLCLLAALGFLAGAAYDYFRHVVWFLYASSLTDTNTMESFPAPYMPLFVPMAIILYVAAVLNALQMHNKYKQRDCETLARSQPLL